MENNFTETELEQEQWKAIEGYDGIYEVSSLGRVRSLKFGKVRVLMASKDGCGYLKVALCKYGKVKHFYVHRLVANAFIPNDDESKSQINHRDECKQNNRLWNIEYCTPQYNLTYNGLHRRRMANYHRSNYRRNAIKDLYDPNLTYAQNIDIFKEQGIECCEQTILNLRKDLGLINNKTKRDEIKDLYRPDLTYKQNIDIFNEQGIECCRATLWQLRKDLGIIKN